MNTAEFNLKKKILSDAFAANARPVACRYGTPFGQSYLLQADGQSYYAHIHRNGAYSIRKDGEQRILEVVEAEVVNNQQEQKKIKIIADSCAELALFPL